MSTINNTYGMCTVYKNEEIEKAALEKYPIEKGSFTFNKGGEDEFTQDFDDNEEYRQGFIEGAKWYKQQISKS